MLPGILKIVCSDSGSVRPVCIAKGEDVGLVVLGDRPALRNCGLWHTFGVQTSQSIEHLLLDVHFRKSNGDSRVDTGRLATKIVGKLLSDGFGRRYLRQPTKD